MRPISLQTRLSVHLAALHAAKGPPLPSPVPPPFAPPHLDTAPLTARAMSFPRQLAPLGGQLPNVQAQTPPAMLEIQNPLGADALLRRIEAGDVDLAVSAGLLFLGHQCLSLIVGGWERESQELTPAHRLVLPYLKDIMLPASVRAMILEIIAVRVPAEPWLDAEVIALLQGGGLPSEVAGSIEALYRKASPYPTQVFETLDHMRQRTRQKLQQMVTPKPMADIADPILRRQTLSSEFSLSLLLHAREGVAWLERHVVKAHPRKTATNVALSIKVLRDSHFSHEARMMAFDLLNDGVLVLDAIQKLLRESSVLKTSEVDRRMRELYLSGKTWGDLVLEELERRRQLPQARAREIMEDIGQDKALAKKWRSVLHRAQETAPTLQLVVTRGIRFIDPGDAAQQLALARRWIETLEASPTGRWAALRRYDPRSDATGQHAARLIQDVTSDPVTDPFGFLLPHERRFWDAPVNAQHPSMDALRQALWVVGNDGSDITSRYRCLQVPGATEAAVMRIRTALQGGIAGVDAAHMRELVRRSVAGPLSHLTLLFWAFNMPDGGLARDRWAAAPGHVGALLKEADDAGAQLVGNVLELVIRGGEFGGVAELHGVRHFLKKGNWVYILPRDFRMSGRRPVADMVVLDEFGVPETIEIKNVRVLGKADMGAIDASLDTALKQLTSSAATYPMARSIIYLRVATDQDSGRMSADVEAAIRQRLQTEAYRAVAEVVVEVDGLTGVGGRHFVVANPGYSDTARIRALAHTAGLRAAQVLVNRLVQLDLIDLSTQNATVSFLAQQPRDRVRLAAEAGPTAEQMREALQQHQLLSAVKLK